MMEYTGVDVEMAIDLHYHEGMYMIDGMLKSIFVCPSLRSLLGSMNSADPAIWLLCPLSLQKSVLEDNRKEIDIVKAHHPHDDIVFPDETLVLKFKDGVKMLIDSGWTEDPPDMDDLSTRAEVALGKLVKEKYGTGETRPSLCFASTRNVFADWRVFSIRLLHPRQVPCRRSTLLHHARSG
jgi:hypothetical protein